MLSVVLLAACGGGATSTSPPASTPEAAVKAPTTVPTSTTAENVAASAPVWRYVNSGWVSPYGSGAAGVFTEELLAFVITSQEELDAFHRSVATKRSLGTATSLGRIDFPNSILLAAYYLWRPVQGDPLSVVGFSLDGRRAEVLLELEDSAQGREYPFLYAPMAMVAIDRSLLPLGEPISFVFILNGEPQATVVASVR